MINLNWRTIGKFAVKFCGMALYGLLATKSLSVKVDMSDGHSEAAPGYGDAIAAIVESDMWTSDKDRAVAILKRDEYVEYYKSVISIVNGDMWSSTKVSMIESLNEE